MLPCDRDFGVIERCLRKKQSIYTPAQYAAAISEAKRVNPFHVIEMQSSDFKNLDILMQRIVQRTVTASGMKVDFRNVTHVMVNNDQSMMLHFKHSHDTDEVWQTVSLAKRGRQSTVVDVTLPQKYDRPKPLPKNKVADVKALLEYIPPIYHSFYNSIVVDNKRNVGEIEQIDECDFVDDE